MITQPELKELLHYCPNTGAFRWLKTGKIAGYKWKSTTAKTSYWRIGIKGRKYTAHRLAWLYVNGEFPNKQIDHIDRNGLNNSISNLREVTNYENARNRERSGVGVKGVTFKKKLKTNPWHVQFTVGGKYKHIGTYETLLDAACVAIKHDLKLQQP